MGNRHKGSPTPPAKKKVKNILRVLTLGISGSGKTTFAKQLKIITNGGFSCDEINTHKMILRQNILIGIQELSKQAEKLEEGVKGPNRKHCRYFTELPIVDLEWDDNLAKKVKILWEDPAIQRAWKVSPSYQLQMVHIDYLMQNLDRISPEDFVPTNEDILRARQRTTGEQTLGFTIDQNLWEMTDVGGQRPERGKWEKIIMGNELNAIIFFAALDEFNMVSYEDQRRTKMQISEEVFGELVGSDTLKDRPQITLLLFLNKIDLLKQKLQKPEDRDQFKEVFPDFRGDDENEENDLKLACECFKIKFTKPYRNLEIHTHYTCAIDTALMEAVFKTVRLTIFEARVTNFVLKI